METRRGDRVVVGVDQSAHSRRALSWAVEEAELRGASLEVVHAWLAPLARYDGPGPVDLDLADRRGQAILDKAMASIGISGVEVTAMPVEGEPAPVLVRAAEGADLVVVGSRGHGGFTALLVGSVSQRCVESAPCPVVVVPRDWEPRPGSIVVGVDGSQPSFAALHWAVAEAARRGARLEVVNAYHETEAVLPFGPTTVPDHERLEQASMSLLDHMVAGAVRGAKPPPQVETISSTASAASALCDAARTAALLVVGSRGRGGLRGLGLGSVSQQCVHHAPCPVVVVRDGRADPGGMA